MTQLLSRLEKEPFQTRSSKSGLGISGSAPSQWPELNDPIPQRFTTEQFQRMWDEEILDHNKRYELIYGVILEMPGNPPHRHVITRLTGLLLRTLPNNTEVSVQSNIDLPSKDTRPEPDLVVIPLENYTEERYLPEDVALVIEVSDSTLRYDQSTKLSLYSDVGIQEYWIVNLPARTLEQYRTPFEGSYKSKNTLEPGEVARCLKYPDLALEWWEALPKEAPAESEE